MLSSSLRLSVIRLARLALLVVCFAALPARVAAEEDATANDVLLASLERYGDSVADDLDAFWAERLGEMGVEYRRPSVQFFTATITTPCGLTLEPGVTAPGFYCPFNEVIYVDGVDHVTVAQTLGRGWLPTVIAHEWGHHVQYLLGLPIAEYSKPVAISVRLELQADCMAGGWTHDADGRGLIEENAVDVAVFILAYLGSPPMQEVGMNQGHGGSEQRVRAFLGGYDGGVEVCLA